MSTWILTLITQPLLIGCGKVRLDHFVGGFSYVTTPLLILSLFLITKRHKINESFFTVVKSYYCRKILSIEQLFIFSEFHPLSMVYRRNSARNIWYIIITELLMILPGLKCLL